VVYDVTIADPTIFRFQCLRAAEEAERRLRDDVLRMRLAELEQDTVMATWRTHHRAAYDHAVDMLLSPNVLNVVASEYETLGYVGETANKKLMYLAATSRIMADPLSVIIKSSSAAGKSKLVKVTAELMPTDQVEDLSRVSKQALFNMERDGLRHKLVIVMEKAGADDADYSIRTLITEKTLTSRVTMMSADGPRTELRVVEGPVAYVTTTTDKVDEQLINRVLFLRVDESEAQTARIHEAQRAGRTAQGLERDRRRSEIVTAHHIVQQVLRPLRVAIPYASHLRFPTRSVTHRRQNETFLNLISAIALLRQYQKPVLTLGPEPGSRERYIEADVTDYELAYHLAPAAFDLNAGPALTLTQRRLLDEVRQYARANAGEGSPQDIQFTRADLEQSGWSAKQLKDHVPVLVDTGYLAIHAGRGQGRRQTYALAGPVDQADNALVSPDDLRVLMQTETGP